MKFVNLLTAGMLASALMAPVAMAADALTDAQKKDIEKVVHDYLVHNPEVLVEASQVLQQKQQQDIQQKTLSAISEQAAPLFSGDLTIAGNPKGNVTLVEFFDYQCIHCKNMAKVVDALIKKNNNLRVIYKEFPIFGKSSDVASRVAVAAAMQGKYDQIRTQLIQQDQRLNEELIMALAKTAGLDVDKLKTDMNSKAVTDLLAANRALAEKLHLMGTPAFIIASTPNGQFKAGSVPSFIPGAASESAMQELIKKANS